MYFPPFYSACSSPSRPRLVGICSSGWPKLRQDNDEDNSISTSEDNKEYNVFDCSFTIGFKVTLNISCVLYDLDSMLRSKIETELNQGVTCLFITAKGRNFSQAVCLRHQSAQ